MRYLNAFKKVLIMMRLSLFVLLFYLNGAFVNAQENVVALEAYAEKIYVQTDREIYRVGEKLWFKSIVVQAKDNLPSTLSGVLHIELVDPFETVVSEKRVQLKDGIGSNYFEIEDFFVSGVYQLRAYTRWDQNFDNSFKFTKYLTITERNPPKGIIQKIAGENKNKVRFLLNPQLIDSSVNSKVELELAYGDQLKKRVIRKNESNYFLLEEDIPDDTKWIHFKLITDSGKQWSESIPMAEKAIDIQFLSEGGTFLENVNNLLGIKAVDEKGKGIPVSGTIYDSENKPVTSFKTNKIGIGRAYVFANASANYRIVLDNPVKDYNVSYNFPSVHKVGHSLSVRSVGSNIAVHINSTQVKDDSIFVEVSSRGMALGEIGRKLESGKQSLYFSKESLPSGILVFKLKGNSKKPLAERLFFNQTDNSGFNFDLVLQKKNYHVKEKVILKLNQENISADTSWIASASVLALPKELVASENIWTTLMLTSELRGSIEDPSFYFAETGELKLEELDNLLLTQGWRSYVYQSLPKVEQLTVLPEIGLEVEGEVSALFNQDKFKEGVDVSLMIFSENQSFYNQQTDSLGHFKFVLPPLEGRRVRAVLQTKNESGRNRNYNLTINKIAKPKIDYDRFQAYFTTQNFLPNSFQDSIKENTPNSFFDSDPSITELDEVLISDYDLTPQRQKVFDTYGKPDVVLSGREIEQKEDEYSHGLYGVLRQSFGDKISFQMFEDSTGLRYQKAVITGGLETIVLVDGMPVLADAYQFLPTLPPSEVKSVEILENVSKNFVPLYRRIYPFENPIETPLMGSILAIYTHSGNGLYTTYKSKGILKTSIELFAPQKQFYIPKFEDVNKTLGPGDNEVTLFWDPDIRIKREVPVEISFKNNSIPGTKSIVVEVITRDGKIGYKILDYEVVE